MSFKEIPDSGKPIWNYWEYANRDNNTVWLNLVLCTFFKHILCIPFTSNSLSAEHLDSAGRFPAVNSALRVKERRKMTCRSKKLWSSQNSSLECMCVHACGWVSEWQSLRSVQLFAIPWTVTHQTPLSKGILQARILEWVPCLPPEDLLNPGTEPRSPTFQVDSWPSELPEKPRLVRTYVLSAGGVQTASEWGREAGQRCDTSIWVRLKHHLVALIKQNPQNNVPAMGNDTSLLTAHSQHSFHSPSIRTYFPYIPPKACLGAS